MECKSKFSSYTEDDNEQVIDLCFYGLYIEKEKLKLEYIKQNHFLLQVHLFWLIV